MNAFILAATIYINQIRVQHHLAPVRETVCLGQAARTRGNEIVRTGLISHVRPNGKRFFDGLRCGRVGIWRGENIAWFKGWTSERLLAYPSIEKNVIDAWMKSSTHRAVLLNRHARNSGIRLVGNIVILEMGQ